MPDKIEMNGKVLIAELSAEVKINGIWMNEETAAKQGFQLSESVAESRRITVRNDSGKTVRLGGFRWHHNGHHQDFFQAPGSSFRIDAEGWMMASPCGLKKFGDREFAYNPEYTKFAVCAP